MQGLEIVELAALRRRLAVGVLERVHRVEFHTLTLVTEGSGQHTADFVAYPCRPGTLLWIRPGQVQRFDPPGGFNGTHVLFTPAFPPQFGDADRLLNEWYGSACWQLGVSREYAGIAALFARLTAENSRPAGSPSREILQHLLAALLLHVDRLPRTRDHGDPHAGGETYARFRAELERSYATTRRADEYAARLGYTVKTLTRACLAATGQSVKQIISGRVLLQAQRLLAHTDQPVAQIARTLGFSEPTNFSKFFTRMTGKTPIDFRHAASGS